MMHVLRTRAHLGRRQGDRSACTAAAQWVSGGIMQGMDEITQRLEYRTFAWRALTDAERRADPESYPDMDGERVVHGVAAVYEQTADIFGFHESIAPGAFADSIEGGGDVLSLYNHDWGSVLGRQSNGTLRLSDRPDGLYTSNAFPDTQIGRDTYTCNFTSMFPW